MHFSSKIFLPVVVILWHTGLDAQRGRVRPNPGNPVFPGWYADPEGAIFGKTFWIYPTYSAPYEQQVFLDAFSSKDLHTWKKHARIIDTAVVKWG